MAKTEHQSAATKINGFALMTALPSHLIHELIQSSS
jgi:hypothetical protein